MAGLKPLGSMPHEDIYLLDSNLVIGYLSNDISGWKKWADEHISQGKKFYLLHQTVEEVRVKHPQLPSGFEPLKLTDEGYGIPQRNLDSVYQQIIDAFNINGNTRMELKKDIELISEAGYYAGFADPSQISDEDILADRVVFASNNFAVIQCLLSNKDKINIFEKILDDSGFEHLITVRFVSKLQTWQDFF